MKFLYILLSSYYSTPSFYFFCSLISFGLYNFYPDYVFIKYISFLTALLLLISLRSIKKLSIQVIILITFGLIALNLSSKLNLNKSENSEIYSISGIVRDINENRKYIKLTRASINGKSTSFPIFIKYNPDEQISPFMSIKITSTQPLSAKRYLRTGLFITQSSQSKLEYQSNIMSKSSKSLKEELLSLNHILYNDYSCFLNGIAFGLKDNSIKALEDTFRDLGLSHVLVASGANILLIVSLIDWIARKKQNKFIFIITSSVLIAYLGIVGLQSSLTRAFTFFILFVVANAQGRKVTYLNKVLIIFTLFLIIFPEFITEVGFIMSMAGTLGIKLSEDINEIFNIKNNFTKKLIQNFIILTLINLITAHYFRNINFSGIISNIFVLSIMESIVITTFVNTVSAFLLAFISKSFLGINLFIGEMLQYISFLLLQFINFLHKILDNSFVFSFTISEEFLILSSAIVICIWITLNLIGKSRIKPKSNLLSR